MKALGYFILLLSIFIYLVSSSSKLTGYISGKRLGWTSIFRSDKYKYGDLYEMSYLPQYQIVTSSKSNIPLTGCDSSFNINLYAICDSYLYAFVADRKYYPCADSFFYARFSLGEKFNTSLNPGKENILLFEISERSLRKYSNDTIFINSLIKPKEINDATQNTSNSNDGFFSTLSDYLFNKAINSNVEINIWDVAIFNPVKEFKANINYKLFNVKDNNVALSPDKKYLLYNPTIDTSVITSSFQFISDNEIALIIKNLNNIYSNAKSIGFKEVYLSIIPNPVSILYPDYNGLKYNHLLTRVQNSPFLQMQVVDIYTTFKNSTKEVYQRSDSHWNIDGAYTWLNELNSILRNHANSNLQK